MVKRTVEKLAFPEGILRGNWEVEDGLGEVDISHKKLKVPLGDELHKQHVRNHEYFHIKFSPDNLGEVKSDTEMSAIKAFEDCRVNLLGIDSGVDVYAAVTPEEVEKFKLIDNTFLKLSGIISTYKYDIHDSVKELATPLEQETIKYFIKRIKKHRHDFEKVKSLAVEFTKLFDPPTPKGDIRKSIAEEVDKEKKEKIKKSKEKKDAIDEEDSESEEYKERDMGKVYSERYPAYKDGLNHSGKMTIVSHSMPIKNVWHTKKRSDSGFNFRHPDRALTDMRCFEERKRAPFRGTILIDCSGSMSIDKDVLYKLVKEGCGCTVAGYSGYGSKGILHILSENGHMVNKLPQFRYMNVIDFPALVWLSQKRGEKIWVSDGKVTGINDSYSSVIRNDVQKIVNQTNIKNVKTLDDAIELVNTLKRK